MHESQLTQFKTPLIDGDRIHETCKKQANLFVTWQNKLRVYMNVIWDVEVESSNFEIRLFNAFEKSKSSQSR